MNITFPAAWSYGLALAVSLGFGLYLVLSLLLSARRAWRGWLLILPVLLGALPAAAAMLLVVTGKLQWWSIYRITDLAQSIAWLALLASVLRPMLHGSSSGRNWLTGLIGEVAVDRK